MAQQELFASQISRGPRFGPRLIPKICSPICRYCSFLSDYDSDDGICLNPASEFDGCLRKGTETCRKFAAYGVLVMPK
jgi:hypothetical protein